MIAVAMLLAAVGPQSEPETSAPNAHSDPLPGPQPDGTTLLPNGWRLEPYGTQFGLIADLPVRMALHPAGRWLAIQHVGYRAHQVTLFDTRARRFARPIALGRSWSGMCWSADGSELFVSGGPDDVLRVFDFDAATGTATKAGELRVGASSFVDLPAGICSDGDGGLFVCLQRQPALQRLDAAGESRWRAELPADSYPFDCVLSADGLHVWVSLWGRAEVWSLATADGRVQQRIGAGAHPGELVLARDGKRLFVSNANDNTVSVVDVATARVTETLTTALYPTAPPGSTPNALALSPDGATLLVANADNNNCAVFAVGAPGRSRSRGFVPLGMYPTSIRFGADGRTVYVANGKGSVGSWPNPDGPAPGKAAGGAKDYTGSMFAGSLGVFAMPDAAQLAEQTAVAYACSPLRPAATARVDDRPADSPIPARPGDPSPIRHVVYVIKENRTYDQILGDLPRGNGDAELCLFPRAVTPNHHALAEQFVLLDNFYVESEVSADGHEWSMGAYATDFVERTWPVTYGGKGRPARTATVQDEDDVRAGVQHLGYPSEGAFPIARPANGYLWDLAAAAGLSYRSYGEFVANAAVAGQPGTPRVPALVGHCDPLFRSFDTGYADCRRVDRFLVELAEFERRGELPQLIVLRLPNDHTAGTAAGKWTPRAMVADNDLALGRLIAALSRSRFWPTMAVFVVEDDAQNGPDHVDAHRSVGLLAGPYVRRGAVVSQLYSTCSMLRTMELILGLPPMSQFDAAARPLYACFQAAPDLRPYTALPATVPLDERNGKTAWGAERSAGFDLSVEDAADDLLLNEVIWKSIKGADSPMPPPRRAAFVRVLDDD